MLASPAEADGTTNTGGLSEYLAVTAAIPGSPSQTRPAVGKLESVHSHLPVGATKLHVFCL